MKWAPDKSFAVIKSSIKFNKMYTWRYRGPIDRIIELKDIGTFDGAWNEVLTHAVNLLHVNCSTTQVIVMVMSVVFTGASAFFV